MLKNQKKHNSQQEEHFKMIMDANLLTAQAWALAEQFKETVLTGNDIGKSYFFDMWAEKVKESTIKPMMKC